MNPARDGSAALPGTKNFMMSCAPSLLHMYIYSHE